MASTDEEGPLRRHDVASGASSLLLFCSLRPAGKASCSVYVLALLLDATPQLVVLLASRYQAEHSMSSLDSQLFGSNAGWPLLAFQTRASIGPRVRAPVAFVAAYAFLVWLADRIGVLPPLGGGSSSLVGVIAGVTGLLVAFRSSSSSDRWHEGRRLWANVTATSRTLMRTLVLSLPPPDGQYDAAQQQIANETLALVPAFAYALKLHLREMDALADGDVRHLLTTNYYDRLASSSSKARSPALASEKEPIDIVKREARREAEGLNTDTSASLAARATPARRSANAPLAILGQLHATLNAFHTLPLPSTNSPKEGSAALDTPIWANCLGLLATLTEQVTHMERIRDTPIPHNLATMQAQLILIYVLAVPLQLIGPMGIWAVPVSALAAFVYYGIDAISQELSDPFGTEPNDLPLDKFCADIRREYREIIGEEEEASIAGMDANPASRLKRE